VLSVGVFAKRFTDPIERVYLATSGTRIITFVNATGADNIGVELEARKNLRFIDRSLVGFTGFANVTLMHSQVRIDNASEASITNTERKMVGQSPYVVNLGTAWTSPGGGWSATLLYNVFGERIVEAAEVPLPDVVEEPRHLIDFSLRFPISRGLLGKFDARNLLDAPYRRFQGDVVRERYVTGRTFGLGLTWQL
jgi:outer membrane receptor protein involved in Fe transport